VARELEAFTRSMEAWRALAARFDADQPPPRRARPPLPWADAVEDFRPVLTATVHERYANGVAATFSTY
jgi:hypothetical protein